MSDSQTLCEQCGESVPVISGYAPWCDCGWNLDSAELDQSSVNPFEKIYYNLGKRRGRAIFNRLKNEKINNSAVSFTKILIVGFAVLIQFLVLTLFLTGLYLILFHYSNFLLLSFGLGLIGVAWLSRPRFQKIPSKTIKEQNFPEVHKFVGRIADALKISPPIFIVVDADFNAAAGSVGFSQKKVLFIGLPLFIILDAQEKTALISHELAHFANGDPLRSVFVSATVNSLAWWHHLLRRDYFWNINSGIIMAIAEFIANILFHILSYIPLAFLYLFAYLTLDESQKSEYLADKLGAKVSGEKAFENMLIKSLLYPQILVAIQRAALNKNSAGAIGEIKKDVGKFPERQFEKLRKTAEFEESKLDATHLPTIFRIKMLQENPIQNPQIELNKSEENLINKELEILVKEIDENLNEGFEYGLYY